MFCSCELPVLFFIIKGFLLETIPCQQTFEDFRKSLHHTGFFFMGSLPHFAEFYIIDYTGSAMKGMVT